MFRDHSKIQSYKQKLIFAILLANIQYLIFLKSRLHMKCQMWNEAFFLRNDLLPLLIWYERHMNLSINRASGTLSQCSGYRRLPPKRWETFLHCYASKTIVSLHKNHCIHHSIRRGHSCWISFHRCQLPILAPYSMCALLRP